jgi:hypothetical protein
MPAQLIHAALRRRRWLTAAAALIAVGTAGTASAASTPTVGTVHIKGQIMNAATGYGVPGMCVHIAKDGARQVGTVATGSDGHYQADIVQAPGTTVTYVVTADAGCGANWWWTSTYANVNPKITAVPGKATASRVNMTTRHGGRIAGRITTATGKPIAGATVGTWNELGSDSSAHASTKDDGTFLMGGIPSGQYQVRVDSPQMAYLTPSYVPHQLSDTNATWFTVTEGATTAVHDYLLHSDAIMGRVTDAATGAPLANIGVSAVPPHSFRDCCGAVTAADGTYQVWGLKPGPHIVCFSDDNNLPSLHQNACYKNQPYTEWVNQGTTVTVTGYGTRVTGIDQALTLKARPAAAQDVSR